MDDNTRYRIYKITSKFPELRGLPVGDLKKLATRRVVIIDTCQIRLIYRDDVMFLKIEDTQPNYKMTIRVTLYAGCINCMNDFHEIFNANVDIANTARNNIINDIKDQQVLINIQIMIDNIKYRGIFDSVHDIITLTSFTDRESARMRRPRVAGK